MPNFVTLSCPTCGARLQVGNDLQRFACAFCGNEHIVKREGGAVSLFPTLDGVERIQAGVDRTAIELTIARLERETEAGRNAPIEMRAIQEYYTGYPKDPGGGWKELWLDAATYVLLKRQPDRRSSAFGKILNKWDGGCSQGEANALLHTITLEEIDDLLEWLRRSTFTRKYQQHYLPDLTGHLQRLRSLEESRISLPQKEAELHRLRLLLRS